MDKLFRPGSILICARLSDLGLSEVVVAGGIYIVKRTRLDGLSEITAKEAAQDESGSWWLWPRSSDPAFQSPYPLRGADDYKVEIEARVIWGMLPFWKVGQE